VIAHAGDSNDLDYLRAIADTGASLGCDRFKVDHFNPDARRIETLAVDTSEPSVFAHGILSAQPYSFLDDAPLEERRTRAVQLRRGLPSQTVEADGTLDDAAIAAASEEVAPTVRDVDELHDALLGLWLVPEAYGDELAPEARDWFAALVASGRACRLAWEPGHAAWVATERPGAARAVLGDVACVPMIATPAWSKVLEREAAIVKIVGSHLDHRGPVSARAFAAELGLPIADAWSPCSPSSRRRDLRGTSRTAPTRRGHPGATRRRCR
jgi:ATP-dependent Lhr-like helicase